MKKTVVLKDSCFLEHKTRYGHPESPERLAAIYTMLNSERELQSHYIEESPREATVEEIALNHSPEYIALIEETSRKEYVSLDPDTNTSSGTWKAAVLAVGAVLKGIELVQAGTALNAFALIRPPGHHAERGKAMGFCIFNNIAIGAWFLQRAYKLERILIVDWDLHHGNGTQHSFYSSKNVLYVSTHQYPYYPGTGAIDERGEGQGIGYTVNIPLSGGQGDDEYSYIFDKVIVPLAFQFKPQFILVSAGYDIYRSDPLGTMNVTPYGFYCMAKILVELADELCDSKILFALEGGYHPEGLAKSVLYTLRALCHNSSEENDRHKDAKTLGGIFSNTQQIVEKVKKIHSRTWKFDVSS